MHLTPKVAVLVTIYSQLKCDLSGLSVNVGRNYDYTIIKGERFGSHI